jgi:hypothetical protein
VRENRVEKGDSLAGVHYGRIGCGSRTDTIA